MPVYLAAAVLIGAAPRVEAQTNLPPVPEEERERALSTARTSREALNAAEEAALFVPLDPSQRVTYREVLENPDDIPLNFRWAQTQVMDGHMTGAAATLERILMVQPELNQVRLFYALVLFRLDSLQPAEREFRTLQAAHPSGPMREQIDGYLKRIRSRRQSTRITGGFSIGTQIDSNRNASPASGDVLINGSRFDLGAGNGRDKDRATIALGDLRIDQDLGYQEGHLLSAGFSYYRSQQNQLSEYHIGAGNVDVGVVLNQGKNQWNSKLVFGLVELSDDTYLLSNGIDVGLERKVSKTTQAYGKVRTVREAYRATPEAPDAGERSGWRSEVVGGVRRAITPQQRVDLNLRLINKSADERYNAYYGAEVSASHTLLLRGSQFLIGTVTVGRDVYKKHDVSVSGRRRVDFKTRARAIYGIPLQQLLPARFSKLGKDTVLTFTAEQLWAESNLINYEYKNRRFSVMFSRRFEH